jgi:hypothetical protein
MTGRDTYVLKSIPLKEAAKRLDFSYSMLKPSGSAPRDSDRRTVKVRNLYFIVESEVRAAQGLIVAKSLDRADAVCSVIVSLAQIQKEIEPRKPGKLKGFPIFVLP